MSRPHLKDLVQARLEYPKLVARIKNNDEIAINELKIMLFELANKRIQSRIARGILDINISKEEVDGAIFCIIHDKIITYISNNCLPSEFDGLFNATISAICRDLTKENSSKVEIIYTSNSEDFVDNTTPADLIQKDKVNSIINKHVESLTPQQKKVCAALIRTKDANYGEIAESANVSRARVYELEGQLLKKLRKCLSKSKKDSKTLLTYLHQDLSNN